MNEDFHENQQAEKTYRFKYTVEYTIDIPESAYREGDDPIAIEQDDARKAEVLVMAIEMGSVDINLECEVIDSEESTQ